MALIVRMRTSMSAYLRTRTWGCVVCVVVRIGEGEAAFRAGELRESKRSLGV